MDQPRIVIDTSVLITALRSSQGASHRLLLRLGTGAFDIAVSVPLVLEYEAAAMRLVGMGPLTSRDVQAVVDYLCSVGVHAKVHYLWRPYLRDPKDDMVLETAVAGGCGRIVTFNRRDFAGSERFGVRIVTPRVFLRTIGDKP